MNQVCTIGKDNVACNFWLQKIIEIIQLYRLFELTSKGIYI